MSETNEHGDTTKMKVTVENTADVKRKKWRLIANN